MSDEKAAKPNAVEGFKTESNYLVGEIPAELVDENPFFSKGSIQLLKNHGTYQQDNRDTRATKSGAKSTKAYDFMVRTKIPGGKLTSEQLLAELDLCDEIGNTTLRITTRQGLQLHGILKGDLKATIRRIDEVQLSTLAACGDVERNVMCCPAPNNDPIYQQMQELADRVAEHLCPRTTAYHEIWIKDGEEKTLVAGGSNGHEVEPIYGPTYLPRKFKTGIALPEDNCIDLYAQDLGLMAIVRDGKIAGFNLLVGGGFGVTPAAKKTYPAVAKRMAYVPVDEVIEVATAIIKVQRDFGNRSDRKVARLKYTIANMGLDGFRAKVEEYYGSKLADLDPTDVTGFDDHIGWREQGDGRWYYGLNVENGRIKDEGEFRLKSALREICRLHSPGIRLTAHQAILFTDLAEEDKPRIERILKSHGVPLSEEISDVRRWSMACPAMPTCGLAVTESERQLPSTIDALEVKLAKLGLSSEIFTIRMTGCPNGCARPYNSDIGLVGKAKNKYTVLLGGRLLGDRLNWIYKDLVPTEEIVPTLATVFAYFKQDRTEGETFGDFCHRKGKDDLLAFSESLAATE
jgi:sulfite reductase (ferredoxin)